MIITIIINSRLSFLPSSNIIYSIKETTFLFLPFFVAATSKTKINQFEVLLFQKNIQKKRKYFKRSLIKLLYIK